MRAAITEYHRLGGLNSRNYFSHSSEGQKSKIRVSADLASPETPFLGLQMLPFLLLLQGHFSVLCTPGVSLCVLISSSYKETRQSRLGPTLMASFNVTITGHPFWQLLSMSASPIQPCPDGRALAWLLYMNGAKEEGLHLHSTLA